MITRVREIRWDVHQNGEVVPTAIFDPVTLNEETELETDRACLFDLGTLKMFDIKVGDDVNVVSRGGIPWIDSNVERKAGYVQYPDVCPVCGTVLSDTVSKDGFREVLVCENEFCMARVLPKIKRFLSKEAIFIEGLSNDEEKLKSLIENGYIKKVTDVFELGNKAEGLITDCGCSEKWCKELAEKIEKLKGRVSIRRIVIGLGLNISLDSLNKLEAYCLEHQKNFTDLSPSEVEGHVSSLEFKEAVKWFKDEWNKKEFLEVYEICGRKGIK